MSCDPLVLADQYIARIREVQEQVDRSFSAIPGTLQDLMKCLTVGTADRANSVLFPGTIADAYNLESLRRRVDTIFDSVQRGVDQVGDQLSSTVAPQTPNFVAAATGLWMSQDPANTFYGLAQVQAQEAVEQAVQISTLVEDARASVVRVQELLGTLNGPHGAALRAAASEMVEVICPDISEIRSLLGSMSNQVATTRDLDRSRCGVVELDARLRALIDRLELLGIERVQEVAAALTLMRESVETLETVRESIERVQDDVVRFDEELVAGGYTVQTEQRLPRSIADEFAAICEQISLLAERGRWSEMVALRPQLQEIAAIAIVAIEQGPEWRIEQVKSHEARDSFELWTRRLRDTPRVSSGYERVQRVEGSFASAIAGLADDFTIAVSDFEQYLSDLDEYGAVVQDGANEFLGIVDELVDQACVGALRVLLAEVGYEALERLYSRGLFGDLPAAVYSLATASGRLTRCIGQVLNGTLSALPVPAEQRFALERANDVLRTIEDTEHTIAEISIELDRWGREAPLSSINRVSKSLEKDLRSGLRGIGVIDGGIPGTELTEDGFVRAPQGLSEAIRGISVDSSGYLTVGAGAEIPDGYAVSDTGYLVTAL